MVSLAACSDDDPTVAPPEAGEIAPVPTPSDPVLAEFLAEAGGATKASFTATYTTLRKLGSLEATAEVTQDPPAAMLAVDDLVVVTGPGAATCLVSAEACVEGVREDRLAASGLTSSFYSTGPSATLAALGERPEADPPELSEREIAGVAMRCISIAVQGAVANTSCITPEGVYGFVDSASQRFELAAYSPEAPATPPTAPFPVGDDSSFLAG